ncbi:DUF397 domain-containing protein [Streptomyces sp. NRRL S-337]|uniref:DUF397 domain-containing protein n=1 Tax=Streptomyces sp. NRRL S-337 TaxID=1463900 RepID=UPI0004CBDE0E|nr:DUF397 domain-containing protein [Streptomyces sp. NRRL S-337]
MIPIWVKSSYSTSDNGNCLEWPPAYARAHGEVPVRDSKDPDGPSLTFGPAAWSAFVSHVRDGEFSV